MMCTVENDMFLSMSFLLTPVLVVCDTETGNCEIWRSAPEWHRNWVNAHQQAWADVWCRLVLQGNVANVVCSLTVSHLSVEIEVWPNTHPKKGYHIHKNRAIY